ncbi:Nop14-like protein [Guyanagaster necrorhizus]|uniref:Nop14-like protein n=1 Tax=Guyanagaster necrorhizus TaxID=856835 RepID=A0A9P7VUJ5_9AGAR|nr:Nop14-like protein [Guyanagaster necrorhizus MCA 3950]KAG7447628.1 Nop14-like protein [Guyanagaster necrorhizus MCA 3950]
MAKGSQLSQLKSALSQAGVTGRPQGMKRKRSTNQANDKAKRESKLAEIHQKLNPFDTKVTKLKHDVGGRKLKGVTGKPAQSKMAGLEQRKKTLLKEFQEKDRAGGIVDRRFGENDPSMSLEDRMLERFTKERQRVSRGATFNLEDEDELTHYGQSLSKLDDFDDVEMGLDDEEEEQGQIDREVVQKAHFGGFDDDDDGEEDGAPARKKSKAEVMAEVMAKSKEHKLLRQMEREKEDNVRHELDEAFDSLRDLLFVPVASTSDSAAETSKEAFTKEASAATDPLDGLETQDLDYDQRVRELAFDKRAKPKDRTKTEEEMVLEEKETLEKAERRRQKRMLGLDDSDSEGEDVPKKRKRRREVDDLDDDFVDQDEEWAGIGAGLGDRQADDVSGSESESGEEDGEDSQEDEESGDDEGRPLGDISDHEDLTTNTTAKKVVSASKSKELPYTFICPSTHAEFLDIVDGIDDKDVPTVVHRIRALHHTSLAPENKLKLQALTGVLIDHVLFLCSPPTPRLTHLSALLPHLFALTKAYPVQSAEFFVKKLTLMHKNLNRGLSRGALNPEAKIWPGLPELSLLRIIGVTWSTSDLNHAVVSPTRVLMGAYLGLARVRSLADIASGLFLCSLFLQFEKLSKRLVPEAVNFVINAVLHLAPNSYKDASALPGSFPSPDFRSELSSSFTVQHSTGSPASQKVNLLEVLEAGSVNEETKLGLLNAALDLVARFAELYKGLEGFVELYDPISTILKHMLKQTELSEALQSRIKAVSDSTKRLLLFARQARQPLQLQAHKPIPIPTYIPKFETSSSSYLRHQDPDHERNEAAKLRNQYKKEKKGAIRELRKDAKFLAGVQQQKQKDKDRVYNENMRRVFGSIEGERAEEKSMEREKAKEKRRAGRK